MRICIAKSFRAGFAKASIASLYFEFNYGMPYRS